MRFIFFIFLLFLASPCAAQKEDNQYLNENWDRIVDHSNASFIKSYIDFTQNSGKLSASEISDYEQNINPKIQRSSIDEPLEYKKLAVLLDSNFSTTSKKVSARIEELKSGPKNLDTLFLTIKQTALDVKLDEKVRGLLVEKLDLDIQTFLNNERDRIAESRVGSAERPSEQPVFSTSYYLIIGLIFLSILLTAILIYVTKKNNDLKNNIESLQENKPIHSINWQSLHHEERAKNTRLKNKIVELERENAKLKNQISTDPQYIAPAAQPIKAAEIAETPKVTVFYAGKPDPEKAFTQISNSIDEQKTIYKLDLINSTEASFEVIIVSDFMQRQIINSPDDFLYRVCLHENSNRDFRKEIITLKNGTASLIGDRWVVDENSKALIKFQ